MGTVNELRANPQWRRAVWSLRVGYVGLGVGLAGLLVTLSGHTPWILLVGVVIWLGAAVATVTGVARTRHALTAPRPSLWTLRNLLVRDTFGHLPPVP